MNKFSEWVNFKEAVDTPEIQGRFCNIKQTGAVVNRQAQLAHASQSLSDPKKVNLLLQFINNNFSDKASAIYALKMALQSVSHDKLSNLSDIPNGAQPTV